ncbi:hypothetical protein GGR53DRAFT_486891 [Hypoxylon sp. FL1150]|nr:hypothetical protein GGR53DRAFT_486891 [Hypoxylon sp. FL1150]
MGTYRSVEGGSDEVYEIHQIHKHSYHDPPSVDTDTKNGQHTTITYQPVDKPKRDSIDSLILRPDSSDSLESPDLGREKSLGATADPQTPATPQSKSTWQRGRQLWTYGWVAETMGFSVALISLLSILIALMTYQNRRVDTWPLPITLNAFIAIFMVLLKAGLALPLTEGLGQLKWQWFQQSPRRLINIHDFDEASRGAWSCIVFLFKVDTDGFDSSSESLIAYLRRRGEFSKTKLLARFAAFLMIMAFAADPFTQQIVGHVDCPQVSPQAIATVARTSSYTAQGGHTGAGEADIDSPMAVAIEMGLINAPANPATLVNTDCISGNCTFPRFQTVGVCHACQDITASINNATSTKSGSVRNYTLTDADSGDVTAWIGQEQLFSSYAPVSVSTLTNMLELQVLTNAANWVGDPAAYACQLYACVRTYESSVTNQTRTETLIGAQKMGQNQLYYTEQSDYRSLFMLATPTTLRNGTSVACEQHTEAADGLVEVALANVDAAPDDLPASTATVETRWVDADCVWTFGFLSASVVRQQLALELDDTHMYISGGVVVGDLVAKTMWENGTMSLSTLDGYMTGLIDTMTADIRNRGANGTLEYERGEVLVYETCVDVQWRWFSYPATLVFLSGAFFLWLVVHVPKDSVQRLWKSSTLAMLFCDVDQSIAHRVRADCSSEEMKEVARDTRAQLVRDGQGRARFV